MLFSSNIFLFYFLPLILMFYYCFIHDTAIKNTILLVFSLAFYSWGEPKFVLIMLLSIVLNYVWGILISKNKKNMVTNEVSQTAKLILWAAGITNFGILFIFKYLVFTLESIDSILGFNMLIPQIALPIGISFFTFQAMSYVVDVFRGDADVQTNPIYLALYISFFPQLIAGPIVRYQTVNDQINYREESFNKFSLGLCRFVVGLGKKILLSNTMAVIVDQIHVLLAASEYIPADLAWLGSIAYMLQIFFDFSAYSDMAIGLGLMFGFKFEENFNFPYISKSVTEFWRRWHISLGNWFKSYLYFPLGGSRVENKDIMIRNLVIVWLATGVWHGANWTFIVWGFLNFIAIVFEKIVVSEKYVIPNWGKHLLTLLFINFGWVIFRADNLQVALKYFISMSGFGNGFSSPHTFMFIKEYAIFFIIGFVLCTPIGRKMNSLGMENGKLTNVINVVYPLWIITLFFVCISYLVAGTYNPFIYFNF